MYCIITFWAFWLHPLVIVLYVIRHRNLPFNEVFRAVLCIPQYGITQIVAILTVFIKTIMSQFTHPVWKICITLSKAGVEQVWWCYHVHQPSVIRLIPTPSPIHDIIYGWPLVNLQKTTLNSEINYAKYITALYESFNCILLKFVPCFCIKLFLIHI